MGTLVAEVIPFKNFKHKIQLTKELTSKKYLVQVIDECILVYYRGGKVEERESS